MARPVAGAADWWRPTRSLATWLTWLLAAQARRAAPLPGRRRQRRDLRPVARRVRRAARTATTNARNGSSTTRRPGPQRPGARSQTLLAHRDAGAPHHLDVAERPQRARARPDRRPAGTGMGHRRLVHPARQLRAALPRLLRPLAQLRSGCGPRRRVAPHSPGSPLVRIWVVAYIGGVVLLLVRDRPGRVGRHRRVADHRALLVGDRVWSAPRARSCRSAWCAGSPSARRRSRQPIPHPPHGRWSAQLSGPVTPPTGPAGIRIRRGATTTATGTAPRGPSTSARRAWRPPRRSPRRLVPRPHRPVPLALLDRPRVDRARQPRPGAVRRPAQSTIPRSRADVGTAPGVRRRGDPRRPGAPASRDRRARPSMAASTSGPSNGASASTARRRTAGLSRHAARIAGSASGSPSAPSAATAASRASASRCVAHDTGERADRAGSRRPRHRAHRAAHAAASTTVTSGSSSRSSTAGDDRGVSGHRGRELGGAAAHRRCADRYGAPAHTVRRVAGCAADERAERGGAHAWVGVVECAADASAIDVRACERGPGDRGRRARPHGRPGPRRSRQPAVDRDDDAGEDGGDHRGHEEAGERRRARACAPTRHPAAGRRASRVCGPGRAPNGTGRRGRLRGGCTRQDSRLLRMARACPGLVDRGVTPKLSVPDRSRMTEPDHRDRRRPRLRPPSSRSRPGPSPLGPRVWCCRRLGVLVAVIVIAGFLIHLPYVIISPGSATPLDSSVVQIDGAPDVPARHGQRPVPHRARVDARPERVARRDVVARSRPRRREAQRRRAGVSATRRTRRSTPS